MDFDSLNQQLSSKITDFSIRQLSDFRTGKQQAIIIESSMNSEQLKPIIEEILGFSLTSENSSIEFSGSDMSQSFFKQLVLSILIAFSFMAYVVFLLFGFGRKLKILTGFLTIIPPILFFTNVLSIGISSILIISFLIINIIFYTKNSIPSIAVIFSAFADIFMTLSVVNLLGIRLSSAGIVAFLMLIGYSVDTDIMLTTRVLKRRHEGELNKRILESLKTGLTMTLTSISAILVALIITRTFSETLQQIFTILIIGLIFDIINTWVTNTSIIKWYIEKIYK